MSDKIYCLEPIAEGREKMKIPEMQLCKQGCNYLY